MLLARLNALVSPRRRDWARLTSPEANLLLARLNALVSPRRDWATILSPEAKLLARLKDLASQEARKKRVP